MRVLLRPVVLGMFLAAAYATAAGKEADAKSDVKSGPQAGEPFAGTFDVKVVTGDLKDQTLCFT